MGVCECGACRGQYCLQNTLRSGQDTPELEFRCFAGAGVQVLCRPPSVRAGDWTWALWMSSRSSRCQVTSPASAMFQWKSKDWQIWWCADVKAGKARLRECLVLINTGHNYMYNCLFCGTALCRWATPLTQIPFWNTILFMKKIV